MRLNTYLNEMAVSTEQKETVKNLRAFFKKYKIPVKYKSSGTKSSYISVILKDSITMDFPYILLLTCARAVYGNSVNKDQPTMGNIQKGYITIHASQWNTVMEELKNARQAGMDVY